MMSTQHRIPTLRETFELLAPYCKGKGLHLNIELKNSEIRYEGMEQRVIDMVSEFNLEDYVVYSSSPAINNCFSSFNVYSCT